MPIVTKGNKELTVREDDINKYLSNGYDLIDDSGAVLQSGTKESGTLTAENAELKAKVEALTAENAKLQKQLKAAKKAAKDTPKE